MEHPAQSNDGSPPPQRGSVKVVAARVGWALAATGAVVVLIASGPAVGFAGIAITVVGVAVAFVTSFERRAAWFGVLSGSAMVALSPLIAVPSQTLGGWVAIVGVFLVVTGTIACFPGASRSAAAD